jgi:RNA polymerase sigma-70 factor (ECF subfamily)
MSDRKTEFITGIFQEWYGSLCRFLTQKLGRKEDAMDVAQEAYVRMLSLEHPEEIRHPRAFLYKTASNLAVDSLRREQVRLSHAGLSIIEQIPSLESSPEAVTDARERLEILRQAIADLPPKCRTVFLLHKFKNLSHAEIAARFGISKNMVEKHIIKAMARCKKRMEKLK